MPYPPDYGGVFDLFYKIKSLHQLGVKIHLHCFEYGRGEQAALNQYCEKVYYYKRNKSVFSFANRLPYIVSSRKNTLLLKNLNSIDAPVLLEGIHCTYYLFSKQLKQKNVWVRLHNVEFEYYAKLANVTKSVFKKLYFFTESNLLKNYEFIIAQKASLLTVSEKDKKTYQNKFDAKHISYLPVFLPFTDVQSLEGKGTFCLYHGNLSVPENEKAVRWLVKNVFQNLDFQFIIAGKNPAPSLKNLVSKNTNIQLIENPGEAEMNALIKNAHIHLLPSFNSTGIKIKLLSALFNGRFIITNHASVDGTGLERACTIAEKPNEFRKHILQLFGQPFTKENIGERKIMLQNEYDNNKNAQKLLSLLGF